jgi:methylglyoxal synthase
MNPAKNIALVAHDNKKHDLIEWARWNYRVLIKHRLICTGATGRLVEEALLAELDRERKAQGKTPGESVGASLEMVKLRSGPLGGDQQLGAMIAEDKIDFVIFFWDPLEPHPHDVDVKALLRIAVVYNVPTACNRSTADFVISSPLMDQDYHRAAPNFAEYLKRDVSKVQDRKSEE